MAALLQITPAEWDVMEILWQHGNACTAADVIEQLQSTHDWNHRTIRTLLARLVEKQAVGADSLGTKYAYYPLATREQCVRQEVRTLAQRLFGGDTGALLVQFIAETPLKPDQIEQLQQLLDQSSAKLRSKRKP